MEPLLTLTSQPTREPASDVRIDQPRHQCADDKSTDERGGDQTPLIHL